LLSGVSSHSGTKKRNGQDIVQAASGVRFQALACASRRKWSGHRSKNFSMRGFFVSLAADPGYRKRRPARTDNEG
jgi:hypothetical protein